MYVLCTCTSSICTHECVVVPGYVCEVEKKYMYVLFVIIYFWDFGRWNFWYLFMNESPSPLIMYGYTTYHSILLWFWLDLYFVYSFYCFLLFWFCVVFFEGRGRGFKPLFCHKLCFRTRTTPLMWQRPRRTALNSVMQHLSTWASMHPRLPHLEKIQPHRGYNDWL